MDLDLRVQDAFCFADFAARARAAGVDLEVPPGDAALVCRPLPGMPTWENFLVETRAPLPEEDSVPTVNFDVCNLTVGRAGLGLRVPRGFDLETVVANCLQRRAVEANMELAGKQAEKLAARGWAIVQEEW